VARHGSVVAAAAELHVTPSAISQQLAKLERELGQSLIERHGRGIRLTPAAALLAVRAEEILALVARARAELKRRPTARRRLVIAAFPAAARELTGRATRILRMRYAGLELAVHEVQSGEAIAGLLAGDIDLAVVQEWTDTPMPRQAAVRLTALFDDVADLAVPAGSRLATLPAVDVAGVGGVDWIAPPTGRGCQDRLRRMLRDGGDGSRIVHTAAEVPTQLALVAAGLGVAVVARTGRPRAPGVVFVPLRPPWQLTVLLAARHDAADRPIIAAATAAFEVAACMVTRRAEPSIDLRGDLHSDPDPVPHPL